MRLIAILILLFQTQIGFGQKKSILWYNVENLFDTIASHALDSSFIPESARQWNSMRYFRKLKLLSRVMLQQSSSHLVAIGLAEIENASVLDDLLKVSKLDKQGFQIIHRESPDPRGIDVAILVNTQLFQIDSVQWHQVPHLQTREMVHLIGRMETEIVHLIACHWPSKRGGEIDSEIKRVQAAKVLEQVILLIPETETILLMGDFNANLHSKSVQNLYTNSKQHALHFPKLESKGTHSFQGHWDHIDLMGLNLRFRTQFPDWNLKVLSHPFLFDKHGNPRRTYLGDMYIGGYSDHLPLLLEF